MKAADIKPGQEYAVGYTNARLLVEHCTGRRARVVGPDGNRKGRWLVQYLDDGIRWSVKSLNIAMTWQEYADAVEDQDREANAESLKQTQAAVRLETLLKTHGLPYDFVKPFGMTLDATDLERIVLVMAGVRRNV